jgi:HD superfamily phosphohydrolase YqeK
VSKADTHFSKREQALIARVRELVYANAIRVCLQVERVAKQKKVRYSAAVGAATCAGLLEDLAKFDPFKEKRR